MHFRCTRPFYCNLPHDHVNGVTIRLYKIDFTTPQKFLLHKKEKYGIIIVQFDDRSLRRGRIAQIVLYDQQLTQENMRKSWPRYIQLRRAHIMNEYIYFG